MQLLSFITAIIVTQRNTTTSGISPIFPSYTMFDVDITMFDGVFQDFEG